MKKSRIEGEGPDGAEEAGTCLKVDGAGGSVTSATVEQTGLLWATDEAEFVEEAGKEYDEGMDKDILETSEGPDGAEEAGTSLEVDGADSCVTSVTVEQTGLLWAPDEAEFVEGDGKGAEGPDGVGME